MSNSYLFINLLIYQIKKIHHLKDFAKVFLSKCTLSKMISRYVVLIETELKLLIMRPYQIYAVQAITDCIDQNRGNGYIWHTTGSGKTLTSFKASTLLKANPNIYKCLFVVDRKDLDRQTREEFNKFQKDCVEENTNTKSLVQKLLSDDYADKVIVTTIQKLGLALDESSKKSYKKQLAPLKDKRIVFIFDECHRSQFGENHQAIKSFFANSQLFGFTGTPIFDDNATYTTVKGQDAKYITTESIFKQQLHTYTITNAIEDGNVLRFHIDYYKHKEEIQASNDTHKRTVVDEILDKHNKATNDRRFNAILATAGINHAIDYYQLFQAKQKQRHDQDKNYQALNIACVFSPPSQGNQDIKQLQEDLTQELQDNKQEPQKKKEALEKIIQDYNQQYGGNYSIAEFDRYYQDIQQRIKDQQYPNSDYAHKHKNRYYYRSRYVTHRL